MKDPVYNTMMGSAYISDRMDEFTGSYVLTLAGYNAGPGRAREWIKEFGDPRDQKVDPIDWIHRIPFEETREYVQKYCPTSRSIGPASAMRPTRCASIVTCGALGGRRRGRQGDGGPIGRLAGRARVPATRRR